MGKHQFGCVWIELKRVTNLALIFKPNWPHQRTQSILLVTKRAIAQENAKVEWVDGNLGSKVTMKYPSVYLLGRGAKADILLKLECEPAPLLLGFVLGPMMEENLRRALLLSRGDWSVFVTRPLSAGLLGAAVLLLVANGEGELRFVALGVQ